LKKSEDRKKGEEEVRIRRRGIEQFILFEVSNMRERERG